MKFYADESCDFAAVRARRDAGYDVRTAHEEMPGAPDAAVLRVAARDGRVLITEDRDFGRLCFAGACRRSGVVFLRFPTSARRGLGAAVLACVREMENRPQGAFVTLRPGIVRFDRE